MNKNLLTYLLKQFITINNKHVLKQMKGSESITTISPIRSATSPQHSKFTPSFILTPLSPQARPLKPVHRVSRSIERLYGDAVRRIGRNQRVENEKKKLGSEKKQGGVLSPGRTSTSHLLSTARNSSLCMDSEKRRNRFVIVKKETYEQKLKPKTEKNSDIEVSIQKILRKHEVHEVLTVLNNILKEYENSDSITPMYSKRTPHKNILKKHELLAKSHKFKTKDRTEDEDSIPTIALDASSPRKTVKLESYISLRGGSRISKKYVTTIKPSPSQGDIDQIRFIMQYIHLILTRVLCKLVIILMRFNSKLFCVQLYELLVLDHFGEVHAQSKHPHRALNETTLFFYLFLQLFIQIVHYQQLHLLPFTFAHFKVIFIVKVNLCNKNFGIIVAFPCVCQGYITAQL
eukprot:TRINITY_DN64524_c1_g1_i1.p2 TRINITY_DN64524_c1_g1~~TRINITY_DN64524_c1_g1_i1.p2  ORF type:complete len:403 (+),score=8.91 TRINITY_DN64524_c1_g1_i1:475-1683(+)